MIGKVHLLLPQILHVGEHALAEFLHVGAALAQIRIFHALETAHVLHDHLPQRALCPLAIADHFAHFTGDGRVVEHVQVGVEQRELFRRQRLRELLADVEDVFAHRRDRAVEHHQLDGDVVGFAIGHAFEDRGPMNDHRGAETDAGRTGYADEAGILQLRRTFAEVREVTGRLRMRHHTGELRRQRDEKRFFAFVETAPVALLHHQHAEHAPLLDDRHAEERVERLFADLGQIVEVRMTRRVFEVERFGAGADQRDQSLAAFQIEVSDSVLVQPFGGDEEEAVARRIHEVNGAHFRAHRFPHARDDDVQRVTERRRRVDVLNDAAQGIEQSRLSFSGERLRPVLARVP